MDYILTQHARLRMEERKISETLIEQALKNPTEVSHDQTGKTLLKKLYRGKKSMRLLLIVMEKRSNQPVIITVIDTSKVKKYLES